MTEQVCKGRILVMDDEDMVGEIACQMMSHLGYEATHVKDGRAAINAYVHNMAEGVPFDVVIMDLTIPGGMGGREAVGEILAKDPQARVLVSSGYSTDPIMTNFADYGFAGVINKPFDLASIKETLEAFC